MGRTRPILPLALLPSSAAALALLGPGCGGGSSRDGGSASSGGQISASDGGAGTTGMGATSATAGAPSDTSGAAGASGAAATAGCYRDPYLPDDYELPCDQPDAIANCADGWCTIEPGCFFMGSPWCEWSRARDTANPIQVTLTHRYRIQQFELTQAEWTGLGLPNPSGEEDGIADCLAPDCPVGRVNWYEALAFANLRSRAEGLPDCYALDDCTGELGAGRLARTTLATGTASACRDPAPSRSSVCAAFRSPPAVKPLPAQNSSEVSPLRRQSATRFAHCARLAMWVTRGGLEQRYECGGASPALAWRGRRPPS